LKIKGVDTADVDIVAHTHLHGDHVGWNIDYTSSQPAPTFPKARYLVPRLDWEHFTQPDVIGTAPQVTNSVIPLQGMGLMDLVDSEYNITDEVKTLSTPGHTPGHMVIVITSQGEKAMVVGDLLHNKAQVERPDWTAGVDTDKEASRLNRESILDQAEHEGYVIAAGHFHPNDHIGKVMRLEGKRFWQIL
jgi:glyoxylase-like metal-dependent hydrolase (beta-lactamase superfamily II)